LHVCVLYGSQKKQQLFTLPIINRLIFITEVEIVYCAVRTESLCKRDTSFPSRVKQEVYREYYTAWLFYL